MNSLMEIIQRLAKRSSANTESMIQADVRDFLLTSGLNISAEDISFPVVLESQLGDGSGKRIDIELGSLVIEVKKNISRESVLADAEKQLGGYLHRRVSQTGLRYLGVLTDGRDWIVYLPPSNGGSARPAHSSFKLKKSSQPEELIGWLAPLITNDEPISATPEKIQEFLGQDSPAFAADHETLRLLYTEAQNSPEVKLKRNLWRKLLRTAFGSAFQDDTNLFLDHTLLVISSEIIAHAVLGFNVGDVHIYEPEVILTGEELKKAGIHGLVDSDFFDWILDVPEGKRFVKSLQRKLARFNWTEVDHDALKHLYESVISPSTRKAMGEYYTPDWLAEAIVQDVIQDPLGSRVLDPSCGSGSFLFKAIQHYLRASDAAGIGNSEAIAGLTTKVFGLDVHPVAVTLARVTYIMAIGTERLQERPDELTIPVYLGDSVQWEQSEDIFTRDDILTISTSDDDLLEGAGGGTIFDDDLLFPLEVMDEVALFDSLVSQLADTALEASKTKDLSQLTPSKRSRRLSLQQKVDPILDGYGIKNPASRKILSQTFVTLEQLARSGKDHIWSYYARNLVRPLWLGRPENRVDILIGNPPWLRYSHMVKPMQNKYNRLCRERNLLSGNIGVSARDLASLFVVRACENYLKPGGKFGFILPWGILNGKPHSGFRSGDWGAAGACEFQGAWDISRAWKPTGFPMLCTVVQGIKTNRPKALDGTIERWYITNSDPYSSWQHVNSNLSMEKLPLSALVGLESPASVYLNKFRAGAVIFPNILIRAKENSGFPIGGGANRIPMISTLSRHEPWASLPPITGVVEKTFIHDLITGASIMPFRLLRVEKCILPLSSQGSSRILTDSEITRWPGVGAWWSKAEQIWRDHRKPEEHSALFQRIDQHGQLSAQLPLRPDVYRVVFNASGTSISASLVTDTTTIIEHSAYWADFDDRDSALYLVGILNCDVVLQAIEERMSRGLYGKRHVDKRPLELPIPAYDPDRPGHSAISQLASKLTDLAYAEEIPESVNFISARRVLRQRLSTSEEYLELRAAVRQTIPDL